MGKGWVVVGVVIASAYLSLHKSAEVMFNDVASRRTSRYT